jgi:hypothetical protein
MEKRVAMSFIILYHRTVELCKFVRLPIRGTAPRKGEHRGRSVPDRPETATLFVFVCIAYLFVLLKKIMVASDPWMDRDCQGRFAPFIAIIHPLS